MKTYRLVLPIAACLAASVPASAQSFFDTSTPSQLINFGARIGVNSSNRTVSDDFYNLWNKNSWGTGFDLGVVADINIRQYLSVQPGIFFQSRSGDYTYCSRLWVPTVQPLHPGGGLGALQPRLKGEVERRRGSLR